MIRQIMEMIKEEVPESSYIQISHSIPSAMFGLHKYYLDYISTPCASPKHRFQQLMSITFEESWAHLIPLVSEKRFEYGAPGFPDNLIRAMKERCYDVISQGRSQYRE